MAHAGSHRTLTTTLLGAAIVASAAEGLAAVRTLVGVKSAWICLVGAVGVAGLASLALVPLALGIGWTLGRADAPRLAGALRGALGQGDPLRASLTTTCSAAALAYAVPLASIVTRGLFKRYGANVAANGGVILTIGLVLGSCLLGAASALALRRGLARLPRARPLVERALAGGAEAIVIAALGMLMVNEVAPDEVAIMLDAGLAFVALSLVPRVGPRLDRLSVPSRVSSSCVAAWCVASPFAVVSLPNEAQLAVLHHAPFSGMVMGTLQAARFGTVHAGEARRASGARPPSRPAQTTLAAVPVEAAARPLDIVLVHLDTVRPDRVGFAGHARATTPSLDRLRAGATWFERAYTSQPSTLVAIGSVFTGIRAGDIPNRRGPGPDLTLLPSSSTVVEQLDVLGYDTVGLTMPYVFEHLHGAERGFRVWQPSPPLADAERDRARAAAITTDAALEVLDHRDRDRPTFLFAHYECAHGPYVRHVDYDFGDSVADRYDGALAYCDAELGRLLAALEPEQDRTALVVYSDHGELLGEHGYSAHGATLFEADVRVLLLVRFPGATASTVRTPVSLADIAPTILALAGAPIVSSGGSLNLVPLVTETEPENPARPVFLHRTAQRGPYRIEAHGVVVADTKYVHTDPDLEEMYRLDVDPEERTNLMSSRFVELPDDIRALRAPLAGLVHDWRASRGRVD